MIRMLHIVGSMSPSGIGNFIMNAYRNIDRSQVQFDFIACEKRSVSFDEEIGQLGGRVFYVTRKSVSPWKNFQEIRQIVKSGGYHWVFRHTDVATVALDLLAAWMGGAKERIAHSHSTSARRIWLQKLFRPFLNVVCTRRYACSEEAGKWMYGIRKSYTVIQNGIDIPRFVFQGQLREQKRSELGIGADTLVLGHVGNYMPVKNHAFMISLFSEVKKQQPDSMLMLVGDGSLRPQLEEQIKELGLTDSVLLTGVRHDIPELLQAMDLFLFPSFYEGMPIALIEAQAAGLPCYIAEGITDAVCVTEAVHKLPIDKGSELWSSAVLSCEKEERANNAERIAEAGFDVRELGRWYDRLAMEGECL